MLDQLSEGALHALVRSIVHPVYPRPAVLLASVSVRTYATLRPCSWS